MPRQLPWKSKGGGGSRTQTVKPPSRPSQANRNPADIDDESLGRMVRAGGSSKGRSKRKAEASSDSDNSLPNISAQQSLPRAKRTSDLIPKDCVLSSSPPPEADYASPQTEPMRKGVSKFDLRDDEWMMVEDEFLETAKLFTRHLRIAEYDQLKESIEAKKREAEISRPVVTGAKRSVEGTMKERARVQSSRQRKAIRDVFASRGDDDEKDGASYRQKPSRPTPNAAATIGSQDTESDDLDAPSVPKPKDAIKKPSRTTRREPIALSHISKPATSSFAKPALPVPTAPSRSRVRTSRMTPFDMLDEYKQPTVDSRLQIAEASRESCKPSSSNPRSQSTSSIQSSPQTSHIPSAKTKKLSQSLDLLNELVDTSDKGKVSKEIADRIAKRKAEREKASNETNKKRATNLDDIPTFLF